MLDIAALLTLPSSESAAFRSFASAAVHEESSQLRKVAKLSLDEDSASASRNRSAAKQSRPTNGSVRIQVTGLDPRTSLV
jgi:hypothetical protein